MEDFFDRIERIFESIDHLFENSFSQRRDSRLFHDRDFYEAWQELDDYIRLGKFSRSTNRQHHESFTSREQLIPDDIKKDFKNLETNYGESFENVKKSYKKLLKKYHPDNFANDPEKQRVATEITKKLNISFKRIKDYHEHGKL